MHKNCGILKEHFRETKRWFAIQRLKTQAHMKNRLFFFLGGLKFFRQNNKAEKSSFVFTEKNCEFYAFCYFVFEFMENYPYLFQKSKAKIINVAK